MAKKKPAFLGLRTALYYVEDVAKATAWYTKAVGFKPYYDTPYYVGFNVGGYELGLHPGKPAVGVGNEAYWGVKDARAAMKRLIKLGAKEHHPVTDVGEGILIGSVLDPFGNVLGVIQNPHFKLPKE